MTIGGEGHEVPCGATICDAARSLGLAPDAFVFIVGGSPVPMDAPISDGMLIMAVRVASGG